MQIVRVAEALPLGLPCLTEEAAAEGVRNLALLATEWATGVQRFTGQGEALFAAYVDGDLAGVGGVSREPHTCIVAMRMRRFYVAPQYRRAAVGRALAEVAMQQGLQVAPLLTLNARASAAAAPFWESVGFARDERNGWTHSLNR